MKKHVLTKTIKKEIRRMAKGLPPLTHKKRSQKIRVKGSAVLAENPNAVDEKGIRLSESKYYLQTQPLPVNHEKELEQTFIDFGWDGVHNYIEQCKQLGIIEPPKMNVLPLTQNENEK